MYKLSKISILNLLFLTAIVFCKDCSKIQQTIMLLPENGFQDFTDYMNGRKLIPENIKKYHPLAYVYAKFPNGVLVIAAVLKSSNPENYNHKVIFTVDRRIKYMKLHNNGNPIFKGLDVTEDNNFKKKFYRFKIPYEECEYQIFVKEQTYKKHYQLL